MRTNIVSLTVMTALLLSIAGLSLGDTPGAAKAKKQSTALVAMLPASDAVAGIDSTRFFGYALPKLLSADQSLLAKVIGHIDEVQAKTGVDLRKFESAAAGISIAKGSDGQMVFEPVVIARGSAAADTMAALDRMPEGTETRIEKIGGRDVHVITHKAIAGKIPVVAAGNKYGAMVHRAMSDLSREFAITHLDETTIAFGTLPRVRAAIENGAKVSPALLSLLAGRESAVMSFAMSTPDGLSPFVPTENDVFGDTIASVRYVAGSMDVNTAGAAMSMLARTDQAANAKELRDTLIGLKKLGNAILGNSKRADQRLYARLINNARIEQANTDVTLDLAIPQADVDSLLALVKK